MKKILKIIFILVFSFFITISFAEKTNNSVEKKIVKQVQNDKIEKNNDKEIFELQIKNFNKLKKNYFLNENINIDLSFLAKRLENNFEGKYEIKWEIPGKKDIYNPILNVSFDKTGEKEIFLKIIDKKTKKEIKTITKKIFVYKKIIPFIFSKEIPKENIEEFIDNYKKFGIYIYNIGIFSSDELKNYDLLGKIYEFDKLKGTKTDYIGIWGGKDFIFDIFSKIDLDKKNKKDDKEYNFLAISSYNMKLLDNYLNNFIANKPWLKKVIITDNKALYSLTNANTIEDLEKEFIKDKKDFQDVRLNNHGINKFLFISNFVNNLSNKGFDTNSIYIFILISFLLTSIGFIKHFIGFSPLGITIPLLLTILLFKFSILSITIFFFAFIFFNVVLSLIFSKYILLYTPKISMILIINIVVFILVFNVLYNYNLISLNLDDVFYLILFVIISERIISIILSKEFSEYKTSIFTTYFISLILFLFYSIPQIKILILAFPETILALIPLNFLIGKFSGLRITEYFRFKEVIKNIEE